MDAPNLTIIPEPAQAPAVVYGELAAKTSAEMTNGQLSLVLAITNNESTPVHVNQVSVSFIGSPAVGPSNIPANLDIPAHQTRGWNFLTGNNILLPVPAPATIRIRVYCDDYDDPAIEDSPLAIYQSAAEDGGYPFPARAENLERGEFWFGRSAGHGEAGGGNQLFAYDLGVRVFDSATNSWPTVIPGSDVALNENYYCWNKPIYAMADGVVVRFLDGVGPNTPPNLPVPTPNPVEGNHFYIQHGDDLALYAHFISGTLNPDLTSGPNPNGTGATVTEGQLLGLCGNSGNSSEPHLHTHIIRGTAPWVGPPRPLTFRDMYVVDPGTEGLAWPPTQDAPWSHVEGQALPSVLSAIWTGTLKPGKKAWRWTDGLAWAWIIFLGGLMITPGGVSCPKCGDMLTDIFGMVSIVLGVLGIARMVLASRAPTTQHHGSAQTNVKVDMHT